MKDVILTPDKQPKYNVLTDSTLSVSARARIAYKGFRGSVNTLKQLRAV